MPRVLAKLNSKSQTLHMETKLEKNKQFVQFCYLNEERINFIKL